MNNQKVNIFSQIPTVDIQRNLFERNHTWKGTLDGGYLYPVFFDEVLPGDTKKLNTTFFGRFATPIVPIMDNVYLDYQLWFVPRRLTWINWKKFMGERKNPNDSIDYLIPQVESGENGYPRYSYMDYLGIPPAVGGLSVDAQYFRSLLLIWNENYRDENLQASIPMPDGDGPDPLSLYTNFKYDINGVQQELTDEEKLSGKYLLLKRGKRMDYMTTSLPQPQKGPGVDLPLTGQIPCLGDGINGLGVTNGIADFSLYNSNSLQTGVGTFDGFLEVGSSGTATGGVNKVIGLTTDPSKSGIVADLTDASVVTINTLRQAFALQQFLELEARGGSRYIEIILNFFGVRSPDYRLQRPEYLGGGTSMLNVTTVAQTSSSDNVTPQGNLSAYATIASTGNGFAQSFTEHGIIIGLVSIRTDLNYQQGIDRHFSRKTRYDFYWPQFAHIGEQAVLNKEIYADGTSEDEEVFGYQERYAEYRYKNNYITGKFRSSDPQTLDYWHLGQDFRNRPVLNQEFIQENPPFDRVIAVQDEPQFLLDVYHEYDDMRPVSLYGTPGLRRM